MLERQDGGIGVNRRRNKRFAPNCIVEVDNYLQYQNITVIPRPLQSPDLNAIEHLLGELDRRMRQCQPRSQTIQPLQQALQHKWQRILQVRIHRLIESMSRRVRTVLQVSSVQDRY